jgi:competence protein ComEA
MIRRIGTVALALAFGISALAVPCRTLAADVPAPMEKAATMAPAKAMVDINTATVKELGKLKGIGEKIAKAIVEYRDKNGPFKAVEDLKKVKGIGEKKFAALKSMITVK